NADRNVGYAKQRWEKQLKLHFGGRRASMISTNDLTTFVAARQKDGVGNSAINRELALLKRIMNYAVNECTPRKLDKLPVFPKQGEENVRRGFATDAEYAKLDEACTTDWLRAALATAYKMGFRKAELLNMLVCQIDFQKGTIELFKG